MKLTSSKVIKVLLPALIFSLVAVPSAEAAVSKRLYYSNGTGIKYVDVDTGIETTVSSTNCSGSAATTDIIEIEVDSSNGIIYFSRNSSPRTIVKLDTSTGSCTVIVTDTSPSQELFGFALDDSATHLYYNHYSENVIYKKNISTGVVTTAISGQVGGQDVVQSLKDIEIIGNNIYWTRDGGGSATKIIWKADLSVSPAVPVNLYSQTGASSQMLQLGIDTRNSRLFFPQNFVGLSGASVARSNGNGASPDSAIWTDDGGLIKLLSEYLTGFTIDNENHVAYWNQFGDGKIQRAVVNADGSLGGVSVINVVSSYSYLTFVSVSSGGGSSAESEAERNSRLESDRREAERKRALVIQGKRDLILEKISKVGPLTSTEIQEAELTSRNISDIEYINSSIAELKSEEKRDLKEISKIIRRVELVENFAEGQRISGREFVAAGYSEFDLRFKEHLVYQIRKRTAAARDTVAELRLMAKELSEVASQRFSRVQALVSRGK